MRIIILITLVFWFFNHASANEQLTLETEFGPIAIEIYTQAAPLTSRNFLNYIELEKFKGAHFYRVVTADNQPDNDIKIAVVQGGLGWNKHPNRMAAIAHEDTNQTGLKHLDGTISMARDEPGSADAEFFICIGNQPELDFGGRRNSDGQGFAVFGRVISGMDIINKIHQQPNQAQLLAKPIAITNVQRVVNTQQ